MKNYSQAPLPFQGQKRRFLKPFKEALNGFSPTATYVDLFGGSGLLSHTVKQQYPNAKVIWNDYDNYSERLQNIEKTNFLLKDIRFICSGIQKKGERLTKELHAIVTERISQEKGFVDWVTLSSNLLFTMNYVNNIEDLKKECYYHKTRLSNYNADGYLQNVERVRCDYRLLFEQYKNYPNVVFLIDPPYLSTDVSTYNGGTFWKLKDYLSILQCIQDSAYFYFTSNKSQIIELCEWMQDHHYAVNPFNGATTIKVSGTASYNGQYEDIMIYKNE